MSEDQTCCDCAGFDVEWMYKCQRHGTWRCRGCSCKYCDEELMDDDDSEPLDLEDRLEQALDTAFPSTSGVEHGD